MKHLTKKEKQNIETRIKLLLFAGLDWCVTLEKDESYWFSPLNPYYTEAFGILQCLETLGYGNFGSVNIESTLNNWMDCLSEEVRIQGRKQGPRESYYNYKSKIGKSST